LTCAAAECSRRSLTARTTGQTGKSMPSV
jgi:hypothetical protein